jgi:UDP-glucose 4-epimerase
MDRPKQAPKIVLTGGSGFLGRHILENAKFSNALVIGRSPPANHPYFQKVSFEKNDEMASVMENKDIVVHTAARAHVMNDTVEDPLDEYRSVNSVATLNLAKQAAIAGVKRFIYISSIKVLGEKTEPGCAFKADDPFNPQDPYGVSKMEAEIGLKLIGEAYGMEIVIIRPPLIYGGGVKGNFRSLIKLVKMGVPIPLGAIQNRRSFVSVDNLVDLIVSCLDHENAKSQTFLVSDGDDMSTPSFFAKLAEAGGYKSYIFRFPPVLLSVFFQAMGKGAVYDRLNSSMRVDISHTKSRLGWEPPLAVNEAMRHCWSVDIEI